MSQAGVSPRLREKAASAVLFTELLANHAVAALVCGAPAGCAAPSPGGLSGAGQEGISTREGRHTPAARATAVNRGEGIAELTWRTSQSVRVARVRRPPPGPASAVPRRLYKTPDACAGVARRRLETLCREHGGDPRWCPSQGRQPTRRPQDEAPERKGPSAGGRPEQMSVRAPASWDLSLTRGVESTHPCPPHAATAWRLRRCHAESGLDRAGRRLCAGPL